MTGTHNRSRSNDRNLRKVLIALCLTGGFMVVEVIGGILSGSLALLADAGHMLTDTLALSLSALAFYVGKRPANARLTYGYQRLQILAAFVNGLSLLGIVVWIVFEAVQRLLEPNPVLGEIMLWVAAIGLLVNIVAFAVLHSGDTENLNIRAATLHVFGDLLGSIAAIVAAITIMYTGFTPIDPLLSLAVAGLIMKSAWILIKRSAHILLEGAPEWLDTRQMSELIVERVAAVEDVHHIHVWGITPEDLLLTMHVRVRPDAADPVLATSAVKQVLEKEFGISHSTLEIEYTECDGASCDPPSNG